MKTPGNCPVWLYVLIQVFLDVPVSLPCSCKLLTNAVRRGVAAPSLKLEQDGGSVELAKNEAVEVGVRKA